MDRNPASRDGGFTLIEVMVAVLIISVLIAIAIPTFMGARSRAQNIDAQSRLTTALKTAEVYYSQGETFAGLRNSGYGAIQAVGVTALTAVEPAVTFTAGGLNNINSDLVDGRIDWAINNSDGGQILTVWTPSLTGTWYCAVLVKQPTSRWGGNSGGTVKGKGTQRAQVDTANECFTRSADGW